MPANPIYDKLLWLVGEKKLVDEKKKDERTGKVTVTVTVSDANLSDAQKLQFNNIINGLGKATSTEDKENWLHQAAYLAAIANKTSTTFDTDIKALSNQVGITKDVKLDLALKGTFEKWKSSSKAHEIKVSEKNQYENYTAPTAKSAPQVKKLNTILNSYIPSKKDEATASQIWQKLIASIVAAKKSPDLKLHYADIANNCLRSLEKKVPEIKETREFQKQRTEVTKLVIELENTAQRRKDPS